MRRFSLIVAMLSSFGVAMAQQTVKQKVAVYVTGDAENGYKRVIGSKLVTGITRSENYVAIERTADFLAELTKEQDYQMSGAVSDNQIARLGQQFGVRYVLVADISEVFESIFISARMIDVQTAQIVKSTETSGAVGDMESLTKLAENIVLDIVGASQITQADDAVKVITVADFDDLKHIYSSGYHRATYDEIMKIMKNYQILGKKLSFPIYINPIYTYDWEDKYFEVHCYTSKGKYVKKFDEYRRICINQVKCDIIRNVNSEPQRLVLKYVEDSRYPEVYAEWNKSASPGYYATKTSGLYNESQTKPRIDQGYVYLIKNNK